jgi:hypothetical protein
VREHVGPVRGRDGKVGDSLVAVSDALVAVSDALVPLGAISRPVIYS